MIDLESHLNDKHAAKLIADFKAHKVWPKLAEAIAKLIARFDDEEDESEKAA